MQNLFGVYLCFFYPFNFIFFHFQPMEENVGTTFEMPDTSKSVAGMITPTSLQWNAAMASRCNASSLTPNASLQRDLTNLQKLRDDAQIFCDYIASSIRELDTVEKQRALKRILCRAVLDFQDKQVN